jgi:hypothetical protein
MPGLFEVNDRIEAAAADIHEIFGLQEGHDSRFMTIRGLTGLAHDFTQVTVGYTPADAERVPEEADIRVAATGVEDGKRVVGIFSHDRGTGLTIVQYMRLRKAEVRQTRLFDKDDIARSTLAEKAARAPYKILTSTGALMLAETIEMARDLALSRI